MSSTPQNPILVQNPNTDPSARTKIPSFDELSELFSLPLSDAADSLGICPSVLKKVCYDNGLVRWPYRKVRSGKSIEEIKKEVAAEKDKQLSHLKFVGGSNGALANSAMSSSLSSQPNAVGSRFITQQPGKDHQTGVPQSLLSSTTNKDSLATSDEFKYGFPSDGLSRVSYRWWGTKSEATEGQSQRTSSLSALRKKAVREGQRALKLGVYRGYGIQTLNQAKKEVLLQIFKSSVPSEWDLTSQS